MPRYDRTGPVGQGPLTGKGFGPCGQGNTFRRGFGRRCFMQPRELTADEEKKILEAELKELDLEKQEIEKRLKEIKSK